MCPNGPLTWLFLFLSFCGHNLSRRAFSHGCRFPQVTLPKQAPHWELFHVEGLLTFARLVISSFGQRPETRTQPALRGTQQSPLPGQKKSIAKVKKLGQV
ncbi:hypothetical protein B0J18DRAFT_8677 [Chaetomium sp. MPI-SDFR-AT-0129]|nr:hypothetical protein B0J18DRAFT_8677 [Chaetomium sp. MPI-SDFR-AT-0129]